jgi:hypothetical protein
MGLETVWWYLSSSIIICRTSDFNWNCAMCMFALLYHVLGCPGSLVAFSRHLVSARSRSRTGISDNQPSGAGTHLFKVWNFN